MKDALARLAAAIRMVVTRGRVTSAVFTSTRVLVQIDALPDEVKAQVELLLPYGMSAVPGGGDVVLLAVCGSRAHLIALGADDSTLRITDLEATEFGWRDARGQQIVFRKDKLEITTNQDVDLTTSAKVNVKLGDNVSAVLTQDDITLTAFDSSIVLKQGEIDLTATNINVTGKLNT